MNEEPDGQYGKSLEASAGDAGPNGEGAGRDIVEDRHGNGRRWQCDGHGHWGHGASQYRH